VANAVAAGELALAPPNAPAAPVATFKKLKGIGDWTAAYVALRALSDPDAFPAGDLGLQKAAAQKPDTKLTAKALEARAEAWRPWRGYAALHLWCSLSQE
jgi:AraC family transcriptional regulator of adaptative response / DNA-3-methyladenine glycosylase II